MTVIGMIMLPFLVLGGIALLGTLAAGKVMESFRPADARYLDHCMFQEWKDLVDAENSAGSLEERDRIRALRI